MSKLSELLELLNRVCVKYVGEPLPYYSLDESKEQELVEERRKQILREIGEIPDELKIKIIEEKLKEFREKVPERVARRTTYYKRNMTLRALLKEKYNDVCQICGQTFERYDGGRYSEIHHLLPLEYGGLDSLDNIVVVCPTCHKKFHYGKDEIIIEMMKKLNEEQIKNVKKFLQLRKGS